MKNTNVYFVDIYVKNGKLTRGFHRGFPNTNLRFGKLTDIENFKHVRIPTTKECFMSYVRDTDPRRYARMMGRG